MKIDARGLSCPEPVLLTKQAIDQGETDIEISVDTNISMENVKRNFENNGLTVTAEEVEDYFIVKGNK